jgi:antitoxin component of MazEF toxin-antitoxin module
MRIKHLSHVGNSSALIIERPLLEMLDINEQTPLKINIEGRKLIIEPLSEEEIERRFNKATDKVEKRFGKMFKRLAQR